MTNSTIPAEAVGTPSPVTASFRWEVPTNSTSIQISLDLIDRLEREVIESFKAVTKRGSEVGGILLGRIARSDKRTVFVENCEPVSCDYSRGPLYLLSDPDKDQLRQTLQRLKSGPLSVVGFFRSNTRKDLFIDQDEDVAIAQEFFSDPNCVFLLVKPFAMKPSAAGFFLWEDGNIPAESPLQFPFRRSEIQKAFPQSIVQPGEAKSVAPPAPAPVAREERAGPVAVPKREERSPIPPPVLRREEPKPGPVVVPTKREEPPVAQREEPAPPPIVPPRREERPPAPPLSFRREERPAMTPPPRREGPPAPPVSFKREERPAMTPPPKREEPPTPPAPPVSFKREERPAMTPPPKREERAAAPPILPKREERPAPPPLSLKREERVAPPIPTSRREEPAPPPVAPKREEPAPPPVTAKREERPAIIPKREERPAPAPSVTKQAPPIAPKAEEPPKREERPPVQPIVAKREEPAPAPPAEKKEERREERAPVAQKKEERREERAAVAAAPAKFEPAPAPVKAEEPALAAESEPAKRGKIWLWAAIVAVLFLAVGGYYFLRLRTGAPEAKPADASLALKVERNAGQLVLSWNRDAELVKTAQTATLTIVDGDHTEDWPVDVGQLRGGSVVYAPITNDVVFKLEVNDQKRGVSKSETIRALAGRPSPLMQPASAKPTPAAEAKALPAATPAPSPQTATPAPVAAQTPAPPVEQPKPSTPVRVAEALPAPARGTIAFPEPPAIERQNPAVPARGNVAPSTSVTPPPPAVTKPEPARQQPAPAASQTPTPAPSQPDPVRVGGNVQEAKILSRVPPVYPQLARQARVAGTVRVEASIGKDGKVKSVRAISGPPLLKRAAEDAVRQWKYQPGMLNGVPTEVTTQVDVGFTLQR
jgi:protein TonB